LARIGSMPKGSAAFMSTGDTHWIDASRRPEPLWCQTLAESRALRARGKLFRGGAHDGSSHHARSPSRHGRSKSNRDPPLDGGGGESIK
jgi:hypothetical protein